MERTDSELLLTAFNIYLLDIKAVGQKKDKALKCVWITLHRSTKEISRTESCQKTVTKTEPPT